MTDNPAHAGAHIHVEAERPEGARLQEANIEKADTWDIAAITQAFREFREETRQDNELIRRTLRWFIGIYVVGLLWFAGIAIQVVSHQ